ncbi:MAG: amidohydrolase family protein, partial [Nitrospinota bacterium]
MDDAIEELERAVSERGMRGLVLGTNVAGKPLNSPEFRPFFETVNRMKLPVLIHPMDPGWPQSFSEYRLDLWIGCPFDTTLAVSRMMISGLFDDFPDFPLIVS